jgi:signal transduction histidine kinase
VKQVLLGQRWPLVIDATVVVVAAVLSLGVSSMLKPYHGMTATVLLVVALSLAFRRRAPLTVAWFVAATAAVLPIVELIAPGTLIRPSAHVVSVLSPTAPFAVPMLPPAAPFAAYAAVVFSRHRRAKWVPVAVLVALTLVTAPVLATVPVQERPQPPSSSAVSFRSLVFVFGGALLGLFITARRRLLQSFEERAERAERERYLLAERARAEERARLAAEMHDVVTHRVSHMVLQAGALRVTAPDEPTRAAAEELRATGCQALQELRDVVGLLRTRAEEEAARVDVAEGEATPIADLAPLIKESESIGIPVDVIEEGNASLVSPVVNRTAYRIVQEALTNVRKHAAGAKVELRIAYRRDRVDLTIRNSAATRPVDAMLVAAGSGAGLLGLQQRVEMVHGSLEFRPEPNGGFRVHATLPTFVPTAAEGRDGR